MLASEFAVGFIVLAIFVLPSSSLKFMDFMKLLVEYVFRLANGITLAFCVFVGINNLFVENKGRGGMYFLQGTELKFALFTTLDVLLLISIFIPIAIISLVILSRFLGRIISTKGLIWRPTLFSVISQSPLATVCGFYIIRWWDRVQIPLKSSYTSLLLFLWFLYYSTLRLVLNINIKDSCSKLRMKNIHSPYEWFSQSRNSE
jgi:hypothetical protein